MHFCPGQRHSSRLVSDSSRSDTWRGHAPPDDVTNCFHVCATTSSYSGCVVQLDVAHTSLSSSSLRAIDTSCTCLAEHLAEHLEHLAELLAEHLAERVLSDS